MSSSLHVVEVQEVVSRGVMRSTVVGLVLGVCSLLLWLAVGAHGNAFSDTAGTTSGGAATPAGVATPSGSGPSPEQIATVQALEGAANPPGPDWPAAPPANLPPAGPPQNPPQQAVAPALTTVPGTAVAAPSRQPLCFAGGRCIAGSFLDYWHRHGGLAVFGAPLTPAFVAYTHAGRPYTVQWYQNARLQTLPGSDLPAPGDLGKQRLRQLRIDWRSSPREAGPRPGCLWFASTGHNVCGAFRKFWQARADAAAVFGPPLTAARAGADGKGGNAQQWFSRACFERVGGAPGAHVSLVSLGSQVLAAGGQPAGPGESPNL